MSRHLDNLGWLLPVVVALVVVVAFWAGARAWSKWFRGGGE